jgi:hypothetical protein
VAALTLAFVVLGGIAAWSLHLLVSYAIVSVSCPQVGATVAALHTTTVLAALTAGAAALAGVAFGRRSPSGWRGWLAGFGALLDGLSVLAILFAGSGALVVPPCG